MSSIWVKFQLCMSSTINLFLLWCSRRPRDPFFPSGLLANKCCTNHNIALKLLALWNKSQRAVLLLTLGPDSYYVYCTPNKFEVCCNAAWVWTRLLSSNWSLFKAFPLIFVPRQDVQGKQGTHQNLRHLLICQSRLTDWNSIISANTGLNITLEKLFKKQPMNI